MQKRDLAQLRDELLDLQFELRQSKQAALALIITGAPAAGRSETINELLSWLDPKYIRVHAYGEPDMADRRRPAMWRYWQTLPMRGRMVFYFVGWYADIVAEAREQNPKHARAAKRRLESIRRFETMLVADGIHLVKVHLEVDRPTQRERLKRLCADKLTRWRVTKEDQWFAKHHARAQRMAQFYMAQTSLPSAPWKVIDGSDEERRMYEVATALKDALTKALEAKPTAEPPPQLPESEASTDMQPRAKAAKLADEEYEQTLESLQGRLALLVRRARFRKQALVMAFEGMDAAGKGGAIRRIAHALDARQYQVVPVSAPSPQEAAHPYLWRFWKHVPERGEITIFDRSWYGRVLVERVRGFTPEPDWQRAYAEIAEFEQQLTESGIVVVKFWLSVSKGEQLDRFKAREKDPLKRFKVDEEDWKNRELYDAYQNAAREMISRTQRPDAPWFVIDADVKKHARLEVLRATCGEIERRLA